MLQWYPEISHHCPSTPVVLVGTKTDLREDKKSVEKLQQIKLSPITKNEGLKLQRSIAAASYVECSALTQEGLRNVFEEATRVVLNPPVLKKDSKKACTLL